MDQGIAKDWQADVGLICTRAHGSVTINCRECVSSYIGICRGAEDHIFNLSRLILRSSDIGFRYRFPGAWHATRDKAPDTNSLIETGSLDFVPSLPSASADAKLLLFLTQHRHAPCRSFSRCDQIHNTHASVLRQQFTGPTHPLSTSAHPFPAMPALPENSSDAGQADIATQDYKPEGVHGLAPGCRCESSAFHSVFPAVWPLRCVPAHGHIEGNGFGNGNPGEEGLIDI